MVDYQRPYLSSSAINSGNPIYLDGVDITVLHVNNINPPEAPGKFTTSDTVGAVDFVGWNNPAVTIHGLFKANSGATDRLTVPLEKSFAKETTSVYLYDPAFYTSSQIIQIEEISMNRKTTDIYEQGSTKYKGNIIDYTIKGVLSE